MRDETLDELVRLICSHVSCDCIYVTGSRGAGSLAETSDYDLLAVCNLFSLMFPIRPFSSLEQIIARRYPDLVDLVFATPGSLKRGRNSLRLIAWSRKAKLVFGTKDILEDLRVGHFVPEESSIIQMTCNSTKVLLRESSFDSNAGVRIDVGLLRKFSRFLDENIELGGGYLEGLEEFARAVKAEAAKGEGADMQAVCRSTASFLKLMQRKVQNLPTGSPFSLFSSASSMIDARKACFRRYGLLTARGVQYRLIGALACLYESAATTPPDVDTLARASRFLGYSASGIPRDLGRNSYLMTAWENLRSMVRRDWEALMGPPFGRIVLRERSFDVLVSGTELMM